jgi:WD40 repeat protein
VDSKVISLTGAAHTVGISTDSSMILSGTDDNKINVHNAHSLKQLLSFDAHSDVVKCAEFSQDARVIASGSADNLVKVWDTHASKMIS